MKKSIYCKFIATILAVLIIIQTCPLSFGIDFESIKELNRATIERNLNSLCEDNVTVKSEVISERSEYSKTFLLDDGSFFMFISSVPLHEYCNNTWQDRFNISIEPGENVKSVEQNLNSVTSNISSVHTLLDNQGRSIDSSSERMIVNGSGSIGFNQRFIDNTNVNSQIYKYQSFWLMPYNLTNTYEDFQTVTVSAKVTLNCQNNNYDPNSGNIIPVNVYAYRVLSQWDSNTNYSLKSPSFRSTQPASNVLWVNNQILDANSVAETGNYIWDVTDCFCKWERGEFDNNGVVFTSKNNGFSLTIGGYSFSRRFRLIDEADSNFGYKSIDMGRAGEVIVNEFTNTVNLVRKELSVNDELLPISISRVYNFGKNYTLSSPAGFGARWNYESKIGQINSLVLFWKTIDGITKYFTRSAGNEVENGLQKWVSDDGTIMWVDATSTLNENYQNNYVVETDGNKYEFDSYGRLINIVSSFSTLNRPIETQIVYGSNGISKIIDSAGRCFKFKTGNVNGIQCVTELTLYKNEYAADNNIVNDIVSVNGETVSLEYTYGTVSGTNFRTLTSATYSDNETVYYNYNSNNNLATITSNDGTVLYLTYNGNSNTIAQLEKKASTSQTANTLELITIDSHNTYQRIINTNGKSEIIGYNHLLDLNYRKDSEGNEYYMQYDVNGNPVKIIIPEESANLLTDPGFEDEDDAWSFFDSNTDFDNVFSPTDTDLSLCIGYQLNGLSGAFQTVNIDGEDGDTFVFGGYGFASSIIPVDERFFGFEIYESDEYGHQLSSDPIGSLNFDNAIINETQYILSSFTLNSDVEYITFNLISSHQSENVWLDDLVLYKVSEGIIDLTSEGEQTGCGCSNCQNGNCLCKCGNNGTPNCICCNTQTIETRNSFGNITKSGISVNGKEYAVTNNYNANGNYLTKTTDVNGVETNYVFNADNGLLEEITEGTNNSIQYSYNAMGMLTEITQAVASLPNTDASVQYSYTHDRLTSITHNDITYSFTYDDYGNCICEKVEDGSETQRISVNYAYDNDYTNSSLNSISYGNGDIIQYTYDNNTGNISAVYINNSSSPRYTYSYNSDGTLDYSVDTETGLTTTYNSDGGYTVTNTSNQVLYSITTNNYGQTVENVFGTTYTTGDENIASGGEFSYNCNTGKSSTQTIISGPLTEDVKTDITTDEYQRVDNKKISTKTSYFDPWTVFKSDYTYDDTAVKAKSQISGLTTTHKSNTDYCYYGIGDDYSYDSNGRVTAVERTYNLHLDQTNQYTLNTTYEYDSNGQIVRENNGELYKTYIYNYGSYGNITSVVTYPYTTSSVLGTPEKTETYSYDAYFGDLLSSYNSQTFTYDAAGNPLTVGNDYVFEWQGKQLKSYKYPYTLDDNVGDTYKYQKLEYFYNSDGFLSKKITRLIDYNNNQNLLSTTYFIWNDGKLIAQQIFNSDGTVGNTFRYLYDSAGEAYGLIVNNSELYYYVKDQFGSVIEIYSEKHHKYVVRYSYDAWGNVSYITNSSTPLGYLGAMIIATYNSITYKGYFYDNDSNLYLLKTRFYNPQWRRFINADSYFDTENDILGVNLFTYCCNDPINRIDVTGMSSIAITLGGVSVSAVAIVAVIATLMYLVDPTLRKSVDNAVYLLLFTAPSTTLSFARRLAKSISDARKKPKVTKTENHHIVAQKDPRSEMARTYMRRTGIDINHKANIVTLNYYYHKHLHTKEYYDGVNAMVSLGYNKVSNQKAGVMAALLIMHAILKITNSIFF